MFKNSNSVISIYDSSETLFLTCIHCHMFCWSSSCCWIGLRYTGSMCSKLPCSQQNYNTVYLCLLFTTLFTTLFWCRISSCKKGPSDIVTLGQECKTHLVPQARWLVQGWIGPADVSHALHAACVTMQHTHLGLVPHTALMVDTECTAPGPACSTCHIGPIFRDTASWTYLNKIVFH